MIAIERTMIDGAWSAPHDLVTLGMGSTISCRSKAGGEDGGRKKSERSGCVPEPRSQK